MTNRPDTAEARRAINYDYTGKTRQSRRNERLNAIAQARGYSGWPAVATAVLNDVIEIPENPDRRKNKA